MTTEEQTMKDEVFQYLFEMTRETFSTIDDAVSVKKDESTEKVRPAMKKKTKVQNAVNLNTSVGKKSPDSSKKDLDFSLPLDLSLPIDLSFPLDLSLSSKKKKSQKPTTLATTNMMPWMPQQFINGSSNFMPFLKEMRTKFMGNPAYSKLAEMSFDDLLYGPEYNNDKKFNNVNATPESSSISEIDDEIVDIKPNISKLEPIQFSRHISDWVGTSVYYRLREGSLVELDKMLLESHRLKTKVITALHGEFPITYGYNPKKSRVRSSYIVQQDAEDRTRNNIASRRSRQRKKFQSVIMQYSVDFDNDENDLGEKHLTWLMGMINGMENKFKLMKGDTAELHLGQLRKSCLFV